EAGGGISRCNVDARNGQDVDRNRVPADGNQGRCEKFLGSARRVFHRADGASEGREIFYRSAARHGDGRMQGFVRPGAELRIPGRLVVRRSDRPDDEQSLLQGLAKEEAIAVVRVVVKAMWSDRDAG